MRLHRFYVSQPLGEEVVIEDVSTIKQWTKVFRYTKGDFVILFNGEGKDITYSISSVGKTSVELLHMKQSPSLVPKRNVTLYLSLIKKDNFELALQKAVELGVTTIVPIISERSEKKNLSHERLNMIAIEALEQCGRGDMVKIKPIVDLKKLLGAESAQKNAFVLQMGGRPVQEALSSEFLKKNKNISLFIGPEGGWTEGEGKTFKEQSISSISLGNTVLRAETAAIVGAAYACA